MSFAFLKNPQAIALILGCLCGVVLPPISLLPLTICFLTIFFAVLLVKTDSCHPFFYSFCFAFGYFFVGLYWIGNALLVEGNDYAWAWPLAVVVLPAALSLFYGCFGLLSHYVSLKFKLEKIESALLLANCFMVAEIARSYMFTGFPWNLFGITWSFSLTGSQFASVIGLEGLTWITLFASCLIACFYASRKIGYILLSLLLLAVPFSWGLLANNYQKAAHSEDPQFINVITVQPNIEQHLKWDSEQIPLHIGKMLELSVNASKEISKNDMEAGLVIVWPETALPPSYIDDARFRSNLMNYLSNHVENVTLITGALLYQDGFRNSLIQLDAEGNIISSYAKSHLVPFGEYMPLSEWIPLDTITGFSGFEAGNGPESKTLFDSFSYLPRICYEIIFPSEVPVGKFNAIVHITNDAWYGVSPGPYQHNVLAQFRAIENGAYVLRSANKGVSAIIAPTGDMLSNTTINTSSYAMHTVSLDGRQQTFYSRYGGWVILSLILSSYLILFLLVYLRIRNIVNL